MPAHAPRRQCAQYAAHAHERERRPTDPPVAHLINKRCERDFTPGPRQYAARGERNVTGGAACAEADGIAISMAGVTMIVIESNHAVTALISRQTQTSAEPCIRRGAMRRAVSRDRRRERRDVMVAPAASGSDRDNNRAVNSGEKMRVAIMAMLSRLVLPSTESVEERIAGIPRLVNAPRRNRLLRRSSAAAGVMPVMATQ